MKKLGIFSQANPSAAVPCLPLKVNAAHSIDLILDTADTDFVTLRSQASVDNRFLAGSYKVPQILHKKGSGQLQFNVLLNSVDIFGERLKASGRSFIIFPEKVM